MLSKFQFYGPLTFNSKRDFAVSRFLGSGTIMTKMTLFCLIFPNIREISDIWGDFSVERGRPENN